MESSIQYKCIQTVGTGQPVYICFLTAEDRTATFKGMKPFVLLPFLLAMLLCATPLVVVLQLPALWFLTDATYRANVYSFQQPGLSLCMLAKGYRLRTLTVKADVDHQTLAMVLEGKEGYVVCSPPITQALHGLERVGEEAVFVGMGQASQKAPLFDCMILTQADERIWQEAVDGRKSEVLYIRSSDAQYLPKEFPTDLIVTKQESENDVQFARRIEQMLQANPIIHLYAPRLGAWALPLLGKDTLLWTVEASYRSVIPPSNLYGVVAEDLSRTFKQLLESERTDIIAVKRLFTGREMHGSWL